MPETIEFALLGAAMLTALTARRLLRAARSVQARRRAPTQGRRLLTQFGVDAEALVIEVRERPTGPPGRRRFVRYRFRVDRREFVGDTANWSLAVGDVLPIAYLPDDPRINAPAEVVRLLREGHPRDR
ncbi:MAG: hypothetical protein AAGE01_16160 [Pseudomonadota bacterium]